MRKIVVLILSILSLSSCAYVTVRDKSEKTENSSSVLTSAQVFVKNIAAMQYIEHATVIGDTIFVGVPSRRGLEHSQDNTAQTFLADMRSKEEFHSIRYCKVVNIGKEHFWSDSLVTGQVIGYAEVAD